MGYWGQEAGVQETGSRGYWGQEAGGTGDRKQGILGTGASHTLLIDNQRSVKLVIDIIIIIRPHKH